MKLLAIETSCDETAFAVVEANGGLEDPVFEVLASALNTQIEMHKEYGGVFPTVAKREHARNSIPLLRDIANRLNWKNATVDISEHTDFIHNIMNREPELETTIREFLSEFPCPNIDAITVTEGPGLEPALWIGINVAQVLAKVWNLPLIPANHMEGHITSVLIDSEQNIQQESAEVTDSAISEKSTDQDVEFPAIALLISGNHTELVYVTGWNEYEILGKTVDDAAGEAFDKVARMMDLEYPGGPKISLLAETWRESLRDSRHVSPSPSSPTSSNPSDPTFLRSLSKSKQPNAPIFPRPMLHSGDYNFSFSGLKTAVLYTIQKIDNLTDTIKQEIAYEFEESVTELLSKKTKRAIEEYSAKSLLVGGGVIANEYIREQLTTISNEARATIFLPSKQLSTDNAIMIAVAGYFKSLQRTYTPDTQLTAQGNLTY